MATPKVDRVLITSFKRLSFLKCLPAFVWDNTENRFNHKLSKQHVALVALNTMVQTAFLMPAFGLYSAVFADYAGDISSLLVPGVILGSYLMHIFNQVGGSWYRLDIIALINKYLQYLELLRSELGSDSLNPRSDSIFEAWAKSLSLMTILSPVFVTIGFSIPMAESPNPCFYLFGEYHWSGYIFAIGAGFAFYNTTALISFNILLYSAYVWNTSFYLKTLMIMIASNRLRIRPALRVYGGFQLTQSIFNDGFGMAIIAAGILTGSCMIVICLFSIINFHRVLSPVSMIIILCILFTGITSAGFSFIFAARMLTLSEDVLLLVLQKFPNFAAKRRLRSYRPLRMRFGIFFSVEPGTVFTFFKLIVSHTVTLVFGFGG